MASLWVLGPADGIAALCAALDAVARTLRRQPEESRTLDQLRVDTLLDLGPAAPAQRRGLGRAQPGAATTSNLRPSPRRDRTTSTSSARPVQRRDREDGCRYVAGCVRDEHARRQPWSPPLRPAMTSPHREVLGPPAADRTPRRRLLPKSGRRRTAAQAGLALLLTVVVVVGTDWGARTVEVITVVRAAEQGVATAHSATLRRDAETEALIIAAGYGMTPRQLAAFEHDVDRLARVTARALRSDASQLEQQRVLPWHDDVADARDAWVTALRARAWLWAAERHTAPQLLALRGHPQRLEDLLRDARTVTDQALPRPTVHDLQERVAALTP